MRKTILKYEDDPLDVEKLQQLVMAIEGKGKDDLAAIIAESGEDIGRKMCQLVTK